MVCIDIRCIRASMHIFYDKINNHRKYHENGTLVLVFDSFILSVIWPIPCLIYENNDRNDNNGITLGFGLTYAEFVDLCILCGCDYCGAIKGDDIHLCVYVYVYAYAFICEYMYGYICTCFVCLYVYT
jgi:hypothetical protein